MTALDSVGVVQDQILGPVVAWSKSCERYLTKRVLIRRTFLSDIRLAVYAALYEEAKSFDISCDQVRSAGASSKDVLVTVLSRSNPEQWPANVSVETAEKSWQDLQSDFAQTIPGSTYTVVEDSGHYIHLDQPQVVIDAIKAQLETVQN